MMRASTAVRNLRSTLLTCFCSPRCSLRRIVTLFLVPLCVAPSLALAAQFGSTIEDQPSPNPALSGGFQSDYIVQVLLSLVLVVGVIMLLAFVVRKLNLQTRAGTDAVRIISVVPLGGKDRLLLVEVGEEQLLLGSSPGSVQKLHKLDKPIDLNSKEEPIKEERSFMSVLSSISGAQRS